MTGREALQDDENASEYRQDDTETTAAAKAEGATLEALMMTPIMWLNFAITALCFGVGGGHLVSLWRSCRGKPVVRADEEEIAHKAAMDALFYRHRPEYTKKMVDVMNTDDPRDILLFPDGTCCFREKCEPELLRGGEYRVIKHYSFEWYSRERGIPD